MFRPGAGPPRRAAWASVIAIALWSSASARRTDALRVGRNGAAAPADAAAEHAAGGADDGRLGPRGGQAQPAGHHPDSGGVLLGPYGHRGFDTAFASLHQDVLGNSSQQAAHGPSRPSARQPRRHSPLEPPLALPANDMPWLSLSETGAGIGSVAGRPLQAPFRPDVEAPEDREEDLPWHKVLMAIGGGTGLAPEAFDMVGGATGVQLRHDMDRRAKAQSDAVLVLVVLTYFAAIVVGLNYLYLQVKNNSPVTYYADPRFHSCVMVGHNVDDFLQSFNQVPKQVYLRVTGLLPIDDEFPFLRERDDIVHWQGDNFRVAFTFALDVSTWIVRVPVLNDSAARAGMARQLFEEGMLAEDLGTIAYFLTCNTNDLATLELRKEVEWPGWEELATNIKQKIRQSGFEGLVQVTCGDCEVVTVYKNKTWANFMHNRGTKAFAALSILGLGPYVLYMRWRCQKVAVRVRHKVEIAPETYWGLVADQLGAAGFGQQAPARIEEEPAEPPPSAPPQPASAPQRQQAG